MEEEDNTGQQHDINEKLLLDLAWERQQKKTFTAWCNSHLRKVGIQIKEIDQDLRDGMVLLRLLEVISGEKITPREKKVKLRVHKISLLNQALGFIAEKGVKLVGIGAEEICDGNLKMTLGMIWTIILRFAIQDISVEELSAKEGLLLWCQRKTQPYKNVNVNNFHTSFKDGLAFCALIHRHRPDLIDYDSLKKSNDMYNLNLAFDVAEKHLDIPKMLDAEDIHASARPDERSIMTYVSAYYHCFAQGQKAETAAKRIGKVLNINQENEKLMEQYETMASDLLAWIDSVMPWLEDRSPETTLQDAQSRLEEYRQYASVTKPPKSEEKGKLETHFHTLQTKLRVSNRPAYVPSEGKLVSDINARWKQLEEAEKDSEEYILSELRRLKRLEVLAEKFSRKATNMEKWTSGRAEELQRNDDLEEANLAGIQALQKIHQTFETDLQAETSRVEGLAAIANELTELNYHDSDSVNKRLEEIRQSFVDLQKLSEDRSTRIQTALEKQQRIDQLRLEFAKRAAAFNNWMDNAFEDLQEVPVCDNVADAEALIATNETWKNGPLQEASAQYDSLNSLVQDMAELGSTENPYTTLTPEDVYNKWCSLLDAVPNHDVVLEEELQKQNHNETLRQDFASKANTAGAYIDAKNSALSELNLQSQGTLEEQLASLKAFHEEVQSFQSNIDACEDSNQQMQAAMVFDNPHTRYTIEALRAAWRQLNTNISRSINEMENQILIRDTMGLTEDQLREFRASFNHYDKDNSGQLDKNEFRSCLLSLGYALGTDPTSDPELDRLFAQCDPNGTGYVTFESFLDFMTKETVDQDTADQVMNSFKILAGDKPYITETQLKMELPPEQAEYCIQRMNPYTGPGAVEGALDYQSFSTALFGQSEL
ncbi:PREDICTED: alpha-actinin-1-like [Amphimedon queenslandica]|uniref:Alpha-actinin n=1 Tax=Amphimedon queenslandica TaxID=400682 RepID=A0A1X7UXJ8_AMPQE|nr:PREDICTED: alpha-actinin-1-like [Amphimedon queenslandica]|eukprot:XP_003386482.1 PREDICTED: alpha-actinin-1-like [Amphimedon queenslandica]